jgi:hypothetical protein
MRPLSSSPLRSLTFTRVFLLSTRLATSDFTFAVLIDGAGLGLRLGHAGKRREDQQER